MELIEKHEYEYVSGGQRWTQAVLTWVAVEIASYGLTATIDKFVEWWDSKFPGSNEPTPQDVQDKAQQFEQELGADGDAG